MESEIRPVPTEEERFALLAGLARLLMEEREAEAPPQARSAWWVAGVRENAGLADGDE